MAGPPASRAMSATTAARLPPALSPATATRRPSIPSSPACATTQRVAAHASSTAARAVGGEVFDRADLRRRRSRSRAGFAEELSGVLGRQRVVGGPSRLDDEVDHFLGLGIEGHGTLSFSG